MKELESEHTRNMRYREVMSRQKQANSDLRTK